MAFISLSVGSGWLSFSFHLAPAGFHFPFILLAVGFGSLSFPLRLALVGFRF